MGNDSTTPAPAAAQQTQRSDPDAKTQRILDAFHWKMHGIRALSASQLKHAADNLKLDIERLRRTTDETVVKLRTPGLSQYELAHWMNVAQDSMREFLVIGIGSPGAVLSEILFTSLFSSFDAFVGHLLDDLFHRCKRIYRSYESRDVKISDVLSRSPQEIIDSLIDADIDALQHSSYTSLFDTLAERFAIRTLK